MHSIAEKTEAGNGTVAFGPEEYRATDLHELAEMLGDETAMKEFKTFIDHDFEGRIGRLGVEHWVARHVYRLRMDLLAWAKTEIAKYMETKAARR